MFQPPKIDQDISKSYSVKYSTITFPFHIPQCFSHFSASLGETMTRGTGTIGIFRIRSSGIWPCSPMRALAA